MPPDPQENDDLPVPGNDDATAWLQQFYTPSKTTIQTEYSESLDSTPDSPASHLFTLPAEKYSVGDELGTGAMKRVRRTLDKNAVRDVALAAMLDATPRPKKISRFIREARITAALEHPNIVPIYDIGADESGKPYFTMKLLGGETLHSILQKLNDGNADYKRRYPLNRLLRIYLSVCNAVSFAHSRAVIHLDLKPANIQVGDFGEVLVLDWGLAKVLQKDPAQFPHRLELGEGLREIPKEGVVRGTPGFMGPEQARGEYASLNEQTDIFALGAVLYTILKCKPPAKNTNPRSKAKGESSASFKIPPALEAVAEKAMARQPPNRYQSVSELAGDVQAFLDGYATKAQQAGAITLLWLLIKRHNVVTSLICLSLAIVIGALSIAFVNIRNSARVAKAALKSIQDEAQERINLGKLAAPHVMAQAEHHIHVLDYDQAVSSLEYEVTLDSENHFAWEDLGALHLGRLEFDQANLAFSHVEKIPENVVKNGAPLEDLASVAWRYSALARANSGTLPPDIQGKFLSDILHADHTARDQRNMAIGAFFKNQNRGADTVNFDLIEQMLYEMNPDSKNLVFTHAVTDDGLKISLHGGRINQVLPLISLPVTHLDFSAMPDLVSDNDNLDAIRDMPLVSIDISGNRISLLQPIAHVPTLTELRLVNVRDRDYGLLKSMTQVKRITVAKADVAETKRALENRLRPSPEIIGE